MDTSVFDSVQWVKAVRPISAVREVDGNAQFILACARQSTDPDSMMAVGHIALAPLLTHSKILNKVWLLARAGVDAAYIQQFIEVAVTYQGILGPNAQLIPPQRAQA